MRSRLSPPLLGAIRASLTLAVVCSAVCALPRFAAAEGELLVTVDAHAFTDAVDRTTRNFGRRYEKIAPGRAPIVLWTRLVGFPAALERLRAEAKLPIQHQWYWSSGIIVDGQELSLEHAMALGAGSGERMEDLEREVSRRGYFDWRTWSKKNDIFPGHWTVDVVYADGTPVDCGGKPCEYSIDVR